MITKDGYILRAWRFREGRTKESQREMKQPIFIQHGLLVVIAANLILFSSHPSRYGSEIYRILII